jgi:hypothetical protein
MTQERPWPFICIEGRANWRCYFAPNSALRLAERGVTDNALPGPLRQQWHGKSKKLEKANAPELTGPPVTSRRLDPEALLWELKFQDPDMRKTDRGQLHNTPGRQLTTTII